MTTRLKSESDQKLCNGSNKRVPELLGFTRGVPEGREEPKAAGVDLAAVELAGREEESVERVA